MTTTTIIIDEFFGEPAYTVELIGKQVRVLCHMLINGQTSQHVEFEEEYAYRKTAERVYGLEIAKARRACK